ncbi:hypothetical protein AN2V17_34340 [Vallitalea sp. AN17-2]|uniref:Uncharacterized protein n=1 Tax=Vallitalea maricola TaxID=3074433 RepID=A0ACB5UMJ8_9FIRM|nr:hypothetical protein AN2V17_34340 [Vallitalea sp. AN17-2]
MGLMSRKGLEGNIIQIICCIFFFILAISFHVKFKCPYCSYRFDPRTKTRELVYCPNCGAKLQ